MGINFTFRQRKFINCYRGNATQAAIQAGYSPKTAYSIGQELLKKPEILKGIQLRNGEEMRSKIADRQQRQEFWTAIMNNPEADMVCRLKASELLAKSEADFVGKVEVKTDVQYSGQIDKSDLAERIQMIREMRKSVSEKKERGA